MVLGVLASGIAFAGDIQIKPMKFHNGSDCVIPLDWKFVGTNGSGFWFYFQDKVGNVYLLKAMPDGNGFIVDNTIHKISSKPISYIY